ncbi:MAG: bifunctional aspartate kinase/homoserine dehydrogenase I [Spirochaetia bacterium]|nr:bifunctional aspartate kinase/homoserine dehydrogenase I [Spirochaetia bacterium]
MKRWTVHAFEGTSCCSADGMANILEVFRQHRKGPVCVVVSPKNDIPPALLSLVDQAIVREESLWGTMEALSQQMSSLADQLVPPDYRQDLEAAIREDFRNIEDILRAVWLVRDSSPRTREYISGLGAVWIAQVFHSRLKAEGYSAKWLDTRKIISVQPQDYGIEVQYEDTGRALGEVFDQDSNEDFLVVTGGLGRTLEGAATSLGKDGAELTATILGNLLDAEKITLWKNVDGVMSADPQKVPGAEIIPELTYQEATELAYFGAEILHPPAMTPAMMKGIPLAIRNIDHPQAPGTVISSKVTSSSNKPVKGFSIVNEVSLLNIEGAGMIGVPGISSRLFASLNKQGISVILISQASSEHSICCAIPAHQARRARQIAREAFAAELESYRINSIEVEEECAILAAVGDQMSGIPGISAKFFGALGKAGVNVRAIAQGSSERNISAVIGAKDAARALRAVHAGFYLSNQTLSIGIIGPGLIGSTLLDQIAGESERLNREFGIDLRVRAITDSKKMTLAKTGIDIVDWKKALTERSEPTRMDAFIAHVDAEYFPHSVVIDCTTSADLPKYYAGWLLRGLHIITPNKKAGTAPMPEYRQIMSEAKQRQRHFLYETTVGAGLPIIGTLRDLIQTGDKIKRIEGVFSGTLAYLFWKFNGSAPFSGLVQEAKDLGFTEPDPRDDLSGMDIVRKTVILAREIGWDVEVDQVPVHSLVPKELEDVPVEDFLGKLSMLDEEMNRLYAEAEKEGNVLKYAGIIEADGSCKVELRPYPKDHPFARITGSDNIVAFTTERYNSQPLVVQGPGAGPQVTAGGVFADLLRLAAYLGAKL